MPISTKTTIEIDGETVARFSTLTISQKANAHHCFSITIPVPRELISQGIEKSISYIGQKIRITIEPNLLKTQSSLVFYGSITKAKMARKSGANGQIIINGFSTTKLLDTTKNSRSFCDKTITDIAKEVADKQSHNLKFVTNVQADTTQLYTVQYNETDFNFLCRMAQKKGEWFYYNGENLHFGKPDSKTFNLEYGRSLHDFNIEMNAKPLLSEYIGYDSSSAETQKANSMEINHQPTGYAKSVFDASKKLYPDTNTTLYNNPIEESSARTHLVDRMTLQTQAQSASLVTASGETDETGLRIGDSIVITETSFSATGNPREGMKEQSFGAYTITEIEHSCDETGNYSNTFNAVPESVLTPPYGDVFSIPIAQSQPAVVVENNDPKGLGRVKVQMAWQKDYSENTSWIRMTNPHAGGGKGMYFVPEIGEEVLIGFEGGNAEKPFVLGAMYNGNESSGYNTAGNDQKVIQTRSGTKIIMNDAIGSVFIEDQSGNTWLMDGKGNISVNAPNDITMNAGGNIIMNAIQNISSSAGMSISESAGMSISEIAGTSISNSATTNYTVNAANILEMASEAFDSHSSEFTKISGLINMHSLEKDVLINTPKEIKLKSGEKSIYS